MKPSLIRVAVPLLCLAATLTAFADTKVTMQEGSGITGDGGDMPEAMRKAFENQEPTTAVYWFGEDRAARIGSGGSMISRLDRGETYVVNDAEQTYSVIEMGGREDSSMATATAELVNTGETRKIGSWSTVRYDMRVLLAEDEPIEITLWVSDEIDVDLAPYHAIIRASASQLGSDWMLEFLKVDGFPVRQEFRMGPILSWQEMVSITDESPPAGIYEPPAGYTRSD